MKELKKINADNIDHGDKRFIFLGESRVSEAELPVFYAEKDRYIPLKEYDIFHGLIDAFVYSENSDVQEMIGDMLNNIDINMFEQARVINILDTLAENIDRNIWAKRFSINVTKWNETKALMTYETSWQEYLSDKKAPLKRILHFTDKTLRDTLSILLCLNPGINLLESIADLLTEIIHREKKDINEIWSLAGIPEILASDETAPQQKLKKIRDELYVLRYPTIARYRHNLNKHLQSIPRSSRLELRSDENFETPGMKLQADLRSRQDIEHLQQWLEEQKPALEKIIDIQKGEGKK